jgi:SAM-dependent methyltransferase
MSYQFIKDLYSAVGAYEDLGAIASRAALRRRDYTRQVIRRLGQTGCNVLEIGPASGFVTEAVCDEVAAKQGRVSVLDFSPSFLETAKAKQLLIDESLVGDISAHDFRLDRCYDLVFLEEVVEHLVSPFVALVNVAELLAPGGLLVLTAPNTFHLLYQWSVREVWYGEQKQMPDTHISELSPVGLVKALSMAGFSVQELSFYNSRFARLPKPLPAWLSSEVAIIARRESTAADSWRRLQGEIVAYWKGRGVSHG